MAPCIAPEHAGSVIDRLHRVDKARSRAEGGFGSGLSIGAGSTFTVLLPIVLKDQAV